MSLRIIELLTKLIKCPSVSPNDAGCQIIIMQYLIKLGFIVEPMIFNDTNNLWAWHGTGNTFVFVGHTDVVTIGDEHLWHNPPFNPTIHNGMIFGRGAVDMKGSIAAMLIAVEQFIIQHPNHEGRIAFLITSDEEGNGKNGTIKVIKKLIVRQEKFDYCLVGEPTSNKILGDTIKNGRRGSLNAKITLQGIQGHVAYPHLAQNPIHQAAILLNKLINTTWDHGNNFFPPTTVQITNIKAGGSSNNIIPHKCILKLNFRFNNEVTDVIIRNRVESLMQNYNLSYNINWQLLGKPFLTLPGKLMEAVINAISDYQGIIPNVENTGGTSDGRFIATLGVQVIELGLINSTIHKVNECVSINDLHLLSNIYQRIIEYLLI